METIKQQHRSNKLKTIVPIWINEFDLFDGPYSKLDILISLSQDHFGYIIKQHETLTTNPPSHISVDWINNKLVFKTKDVYKLELQNH